MPFKGYREESRKNYGSSDEPHNLEQIRTGAILRIADATEKMAQRHTDLIRDRDHYEAKSKRLNERVAFLERSNASLRGHLKRAKAALLKGEPEKEQ